jgi:Rhodopirellula transposase DDE domain
VCHFPPGTSKWNKIEHRLFSHIAMNWRGTPLVDLATVVSLIGSTHSRSGLRVRSELDRGEYPGGVTVTDAQLATAQQLIQARWGVWFCVFRTKPFTAETPGLKIREVLDR